ncbi:MAG: c-type cytochrome [Pseudomonas sp.]
MSLSHNASGFLGIALLALLPLSFSMAAAPSAERQAELEHLLTQDCGACHGLYLTGGLGPALTRTALAGKSRASLIATITEGRPGTPMPSWKGLLSEPDIAWLADLLQTREPRP